MSEAFDDGQVIGQCFVQVTQYEPNTITAEVQEQHISSDLDLLYTPGIEDGKSPQSLEVLQNDRDYLWGILSGLKGSQ